MTRTPIIAALLTALAAGGVAVAADGGPSPALSLVNAGQEVAEGADESTTTTERTLVPQTTTSTTTTEPPTTTMAPTTSTTPPTTAPPPTTTTAAPSAQPLGLQCVAATGTKTGDDHHAGITCGVDGVHERAAKIALFRDGVMIAKTHDTSATRYHDADVRPGQTYSYQAQTCAEDGTLLQASDSIRATAPEGAGTDGYDGPMVMRCSASTAKTDDDPGIGCEWKGVPDGTATLALSRDGEVIVRKDDPTKTSWWDGDVERGRSYTYVLRAHAADGSLLAEAGPVVVTAGEGA